MGRLLYSRYWPVVQRILPLAALAVYGVAIYAVAEVFPLIADGHVRYALAFVIVQAISLLLLAGGLIAGKAIAVRRNGRRQRRIEQLRDRFGQYSFGSAGEPQLLESARTHPSEFLEVWEASLGHLKGSSRRRVEALLTTSGLDHQLQAQLADQDPGQVLRAIALLRKLENPPMEAIEKSLQHSADVVRTAARITIAARGSSEAQERVLDQLPHLPFWQRVVVFQQMPADSPALVEYLARAFEAEDDTIVLAALEFVLSRQRLQQVHHARRLATSASVEVRIKFFRALPFLATDEDAESLVLIGLDDPDWRTRAMAARSCGVLHVVSLGPELARRFATATNPVEAGHLARTLAALEGDSLRRLREFTAATNDMTRAVATEVIEKHLARAQEPVL